MKKILILSLIILSSCTLKKIVQHHGVHNLEQKQKILKIDYSNKNEIFRNIGPPSLSENFTNDVYIYIERKTSGSKIRNLGKKNVLINNVLVLEINNKGILVDKKFYNKDDMNNIKFDESQTKLNFAKKSFINNVLSSMIQRVDDPLGKKKIKN